MSDTSNGVGWWIGWFLLFWMWYVLFFMFITPLSYNVGVVFLASFIATIFTACVIAAIASVIRKRPESTFKDGDVLGDDALDIYTPTRTSKQWDTVTPVYNIEEVGEYAECPYCGSNIRETFYELGGVVRCNKCGAFHHKECFEYYGGKCGSPSCKLRET